MNPVTRTYGLESILLHWFALEEVWKVHLEAVASEVVGKKLAGIEKKNERTPRVRQGRTGSRGCSGVLCRRHLGGKEWPCLSDSRS